MHDLAGDLIVESVHGSGATFILLLPIPDPASARAASVPRRTRLSKGPPPPFKRTVLVVDDDERVLRAYARTLGRACEVLTARDAREAVELLSSGSQPDAVISELSLPEMDGEQLFEWLEQERPELAKRTIFVSSETTQQQYAAFLNAHPNRVLTKPMSEGALLGALEDAPQ
jgi:CheY-like chemotaxis protein